MPVLRRVLIARAGALGDVILLRTTIASLRNAGASVTLLAPSPAADTLVPEVERVVPWDSAAVARALADPQRAKEALGTFDVAIAYSRSDALARTLRAAADDVIVHDPTPIGMHAARWLAEPLGRLGISVAKPGPLPTDEAAHRAAQAWRLRLPDDFLALHPGSGSAAKNWPVDRYAALVRSLSPARPWLLSLGPADGAAEPLAGEPNAVVARDVPPRPLAALLAEAGCYVGNDSGVSHLAAATGAPTLALFGPSSPETWSPIGRCVAVVRAPDGRMEKVAIEEVTSAARALRSR